MTVEIIPSILSADFANLERDVRAAMGAGIRTVQVDVMDGRFVPNISVGLPIVRALKAATDVRLDVHLMIVEPERWLVPFAEAGADVITVHVEACTHLHRALEQIRGLGLKAGAAINPSTPSSALSEVIELLDVAVVMTVNPGFGGQRFIASVLPKVTALQARMDAAGHGGEVQVDGGIDVETIGVAATAGARQCVAGSAVFATGLPISEAVEALNQAAR